MDQVPLILTKTQNHVRPRATSNHRCKPVVPPKGAALGSARHPCEARGWTRGLTGTSRPLTLTDGVGTGRSTSPPPGPRPPAASPPPAARFLSKQTLGGGDGGGRAECQGNPGNKPQTHASGPARPSPQLGSPTPVGPGVAGERVPPPGARRMGSR